MKSGVVTEP
jgi:hypothetical protein